MALTDQGLSLIEAMIAPHVENARAALAGLTVAEQQQLNALLTKLLAGMGQRPPADS